MTHPFFSISHNLFTFETCFLQWILGKPTCASPFLLSLSFNSFQSSVAIHVETDHFFCRPKQMTGFYMKCNSGPKWVNNLTLLWRNERVNNFQTYCATSTFRDKHFILVTQANYYLYLIIIYPHPLVFHLVFPLVV